VKMDCRCGGAGRGARGSGAVPPRLQPHVASSMPHLAPNSPELTSHALAPPVTMQGSQAPHFLPRVGTSPSNGPGRTEEVEAWSGEDDDEEGDGIDGPSRKRQRTGRPISVSCERCKERKVSRLPYFSSHASSRRRIRQSQYPRNLRSWFRDERSNSLPGQV